jgi:hypothetical protein
MSYAYTKDEIISPAGAFYAVAVYAAARFVAQHVPRLEPKASRAVVCLVLAVTATLWAFRSAGVHHMIRVQAFKERNDWATVTTDTYIARDVSHDRGGAAVVQQLRAAALEMRVTNPGLLPRWQDRWWGE